MESTPETTVPFANPMASLPEKTADDLGIANTRSVEPTETELSDFYRCFLLDIPFTKEFSLLNDKWKPKFTTISVNQNNLVKAKIQEDEVNKLASANMDYFVQISAYRICLHLLTINGKSPWKIEEVKTLADLTARYDELRSWNTSKVSALTKVFSTFDELVVALVRGTNDQNFWKAASQS